MDSTSDLWTRIERTSPVERGKREKMSPKTASFMQQDARWSRADSTQLLAVNASRATKEAPNVMKYSNQANGRDERPYRCGRIHLGATHQMWLALFLSVAGLSITNQPYHAFGAQANTDVIHTISIAKQQQQPQLSAGHRFKYPPLHTSATATATTSQVAHSPANQDGGSAHKLTRTRRNLVRLELNPDLQLQLKLKPLPLPMPPPPAGVSSRAAPGAQIESGVSDELSEKRKRSLDVASQFSNVVNDWMQTTTTSTSTSTSTTPAPEAVSELRRSSDLPAHAGRHDLLAFAWREAKRVLLLSSMAPAILQAKLERRIADLSTEASATSPASSGQQQRVGPAETRMDDFESSGNSLVTAFNDSSSTDVENSEQTSGTGEVRRQRHNSQQIQGLGSNGIGIGIGSSEPAPPADDSRMQAMAAAMLPLFWPSFQLGANQLASQQANVDAQTPVPAPENSGWLMKYTQLDRSPKQLLDEQPETRDVAEMEEQPQMHSQAKVRSKRRKPSYLMQPARSRLNQATPTPYPESTRMASKYPLPKIKFQPQETSSGAASPPMTTAASKPTGAPQPAASKPSILPKSLSRLIEHQLLHNASSLLAHYRATAGAGGLAPSTSVSKVVRLRNATDHLQIVKLQPAADVFDSHRHPSTTTTTTTTTTSPPIVTSTRAFVGPPLRPRLKATTTTTSTTTPPPNTTTPKQRETTTPASPTKKKLRPAVVRAIKPTEPSAPYKSLPAPTSTQKPVTAVGEDPEKSNKIDEAKPTPAGNMLSKIASKRQRNPLGISNSPNSLSDKSTVKLFHFKRKPDMKKLPFYKKPLNYTELGWTPEQIQEHLAKEGESGEGESPESEAQSEQHSGEGREDGLFARQKRRRRGKNHFERLMAELHSPPGSGTSDAEDGAKPEGNPSGGDTPSSDELPSLATEKQARIGPVMEMKSDSAQLPPRQQKRRTSGLLAQGSNNGTASEPATNGLGASDDASGSGKAHLEQQVAQNNNNGTSKPIIRKRRKHHGDQPFVSHSLPNQQWRPSRPLGAGWEPTHGERLLLVPSSVLTPSGSQLVPLFADEQRQGELESAGWQNWHRPQMHQGFDMDPKPNDGIAPSGEESFLQAPNNNNENSIKRQPQILSQQSALEIRVPKLLSRPLRPAKYSLNGYIPKPTLAQQQQSMAATASQHLAEQPSNGPPAPTSQAVSTTSNSLKPKLRNPLLLNGKDLDPSTSNKVFSRRRGLQLHQRSISGALQNGSDSNKLSFKSLLNSDQSARSKQLEENRRKYLVQPTRAPILSMQKVNMIKAKLGLTSPQNDGNKTSQNLDQITSVPHPQILTDALADKQQLATQLTAGAQPLSSIPKTDFECTDSKGKFVAGLFADQKTGCQVWHLCSNNRRYSFLCPSGTIFNAKLRICDWRYNVKC